MRFSLAAAIGAAVLISTLGAGPVSAHEGHDHGAPATRPIANASPRAEVTSDALELVAIAQGSKLLITLDRFTTNEPIEGATIEVETPTGPVAAVANSGVYRIDAPWLAKPGRLDLIFTVTAEGIADVLPLTLEIPDPAAAQASAASSWLTGEAGKDTSYRKLIIIAVLAFLLGAGAMALTRRRGRAVAGLMLCVVVFASSRGFAHEGEDHGQPAAVAQAQAREAAQRLPDGGLFVPKGTQRIFAIRTVLTENRTHARTVELPGRVIPDPNASGYVQAAVGGRLSPPPGGFPRLGTPVRAGDVLAYVTPPLQAIDVSDMRQRQGELDQQISIVERRLARYEQLAPSGAVARFQLEETKLELDGLKERRASLDKVRRESEALVAPVSGIVAEGNAIAGQIAQPNAIVFHIVDPARLWIEALSFNPLVGAPAASAKTGNGQSLALSYRGSGFADRSQSIPVHFAIEGDVAGLRAGQFVTVLVTTGKEEQGVAIPRTSLMRNASGQDIVYEHTRAERFEPRPVRVEPLDGDRVLVAAGLAHGKRVVTQGAELLDHVR